MERDAEEGSREHAAADCTLARQLAHTDGRHVRRIPHTLARTRTLIGALTPPCRQREEMGLNERRKSWRRS